MKPTALELKTPDRPEPLSGLSASVSTDRTDAVHISVDVHPSVQKTTLTILLRPGSEDEKAKAFPTAECAVDGEIVTVTVEGEEQPWKWYIVEIGSGTHDVTMSFLLDTTMESWTGDAAVWMSCQQEIPGVELTLSVNSSVADRILPPSPVPPGVFKKYKKLADLPIEVR